MHQSLSLPDSTESVGQPYQVRLRQFIASNDFRYETPWEHESAYEAAGSFQYTSTHTNQDDAGPSDQGQLSGFLPSEVFDHCSETTPALHFLPDLSFESSLWTPYFDVLDNGAFAKSGAAGQALSQTGQA